MRILPPGIRRSLFDSTFNIALQTIVKFRKELAKTFTSMGGVSSSWITASRLENASHCSSGNITTSGTREVS
ncbi:hypothetical protein [Chlorogloeopsis fritschii]|uniref:hypothetical protein n=1 Tax=Chlorogloeopsis fritschii TaxID=1124 RepID=UPI0023F0FAF7|nr:hypothetical protein [Chlorogloeopsis fritschii]